MDIFAKRLISAMLLGICCAAFSETTRCDDWPHWRGPNYDGISRETGIADKWPADGLLPAWSHDIGIGFSSVSVSDGRLFAMGHVDGKELVWCLDADSGALLWKHDYPCQLIDNLHEGGPCSTPTVDGRFVYTLGKEGQLFCLQAETGAVVWQKNLQQDLAVETPEWGFSSSARILNDQLILEAGRVVSYDKRTGAKRWQTEHHQAGYGTVTVFEHDGRQLLASLDCDGLRILDSVDGKQLAFQAWKSPYRTNSTTPIVHKDLIFISTGYNVGCGLFQLKAGGLSERYANRNMRNHFNNSVLHNGWLYGFDGDSHNSRVVTLRCVNFESGEMAWSQRNLGCGSLTIIDGKLLILSEQGELVLARASADGFHELARSPFLEGRCWTVPVAANGRVYGRNAAGRLVCARLPRAD